MSNETDNVQRAAMIACDLLSTCPRCGDLNPPHLKWCSSCGCGLYTRRMRWLSTRSTDLSPTERAEASGVA